MPENQVKLEKFVRPRVVLWCLTFVYAILWAVVIATRPEAYDLGLVNDVSTVLEFSWTGIAETAALAELLLTLPSEDGRGGP